MLLKQTYTNSGSDADAAGWFGPKQFALFLFVLICAAFPDVLFGGGTFFYRDFGIFGYPLAFHHRESIWQGEIPLWNPFSTSGLPFLAQWNTLVCYPLSLIYLLFPLSWSLGVFCLFHVFIAGLGMYFLAFAWSQNRLGACVSGLTFAFSGLALSCLKWPNNIAALAWMPWIVLLVEQGVILGGRRLLLAGILGAVQMLSGAPEIILFTWLILAGLLILRMCGCPDSEENQSQPSRGLLAARFIAIVTIVAGLAAIQLFPFLDLLWHSQRDSGFTDSSWAMPLWGWANLLVPLFRSFPSYQGVYAQFGQYWISSYYVGIGTLLLAVIAVCRCKERRVRFLASVAILSMIFALGTSGVAYEWFSKFVPLVRIVRFPIKFVVVAVFILPILAAYGISILSASCAREELDSAVSKPSWPTFLIPITAIMLVLTGGIVWYANAHPLPTDDWPATWKNAATRAGLLSLIAGTLSGIYRFSMLQTRHGLSIVLLMLLWLDLHSHAPRLSPTVERWVYDESLVKEELKMNPQPAAGASRAMITPYADYRLNHVTLTNAAQDFLYNRMSQFANANLLDRIPKVDGFFSLYVQAQDQVQSLQYASTNTSLPKLQNFLGVSQTTSEKSLIKWASRTNFHPLVTGGQTPLFATPEATLQGLADSGFDPTHVVYLPEAATALTGVKAATNVKIDITEFTAHEVEIDIETEQPAWVVVAQTHYHPWRAYVNGSPSRLWQANHAFQAFEVPAGTSSARLVYEDTAFKAGATLTILTCLVILGLWYRLNIRHDNQNI